MNGLKSLVKKDRNVSIFLIGFCFVSDAVLTIQQFFAIYFSQVWLLDDTAKVVLMGILFAGAIPGAYFSGLLCHKMNIKKLFLSISIIMNILFFIMIFLRPTMFFVYMLILLLGLAWGSFYTVSRILFISISPKKRLGEYFGFYSVFQRFASIIGPLVWSLSIFYFSFYGAAKYKIAVFLLSILMIIGNVILSKVKYVYQHSL